MDYKVLLDKARDLNNERKFFQYFFYDMTAERTYLRFLGDSYEEMEAIVKETIAEMALCKNVIFVNETNLNGDAKIE